MKTARGTSRNHLLQKAVELQIGLMFIHDVKILDLLIHVYLIMMNFACRAPKKGESILTLPLDSLPCVGESIFP